MRANWKEIPKDNVHGQWAAMYVTMTPKGEIKMSRMTHERLGGAEAFHVLFDAANNRIGLKPTTRGMRNAFRACPTGIHGGKVVRAYRLLAEAGIILPQTIRFYDAEIDTDGILILSLRTAAVPKSVKSHARRRSEVSTGSGSDRVPKTPLLE